MAGSISLSDILHNRPAVVPTIYGYTLPDVADRGGYIKIGYTDRGDTETRIKEQLYTAAIPFRILFKESAMRSDGTCFTDKDIHRLLKHKGFRQLNEGEDRNEWFCCTEKDALDAIEEMRTGIRFEGQRTWTFSMRKEQQTAVGMAKKYFEQAKEEDPTRPPKFLWNAKMRFGKTFATYQLARAMDFKKILILTFKPAVESAWQEDLTHHVDFVGWQFVSNKEARFDAKQLDEQFEACDKTKPIVVFGSFQDLLGTNDAGGIKAKNEFIHSTNWDLVVFDEYHFGAWRENAKNLFERFDEENDDFDIEKYQKEEAGNAINETFLPISAFHYLYLSGTPFRALNSGEFLEDQVFNWTYSDEQSAKENWQGPGENPYAALPKMIMLTYKVPDSIINPETFEMVQTLMTTRTKGRNRKSSVSIFSSKVKCGDCGSWYGPKVWHSNDAYRKVIWQCNHKFDGQKCATPTLTEDEIKELFLRAANQVIDQKEQFIAIYEQVLSRSLDTTALESELSDLEAEINIATELIEECIKENAHVALDQVEYQKRYDGLVARFDKAKTRHTEVTDLIAERTGRRHQIETYLKELRSREPLTEFHETDWLAMVDYITVHSKKDIRVTFKDGTEIKA